MAKNKKNKNKSKESTIVDYYDIKKEQVDDLVAALKGDDTQKFEAPSMDMGEVTGDKELQGKQFNPYKRDKLANIPRPIVAIFVKIWFAGMVCFLFTWGMFSVFSDHMDALVVNGIVMGIVTDVLINPALRYFDDDTGYFNNFMLFPFPFKKYWTFFTNIIYSLAIIFGVNYIYMGINLAFNTESFGVEPILFGVFYTVIDMAFIGVKDLIVFLVKRHKEKKAAAGEGAAAEAARQEPFADVTGADGADNTQNGE